MRSKRQNKKLLLLILLLTVTVGFALLSTTLQINGISRIKGNIWNIHWDSTSIRLNNEGVATATGPNVSTVTTTDDTVAFEVNLELPGEFFEFTVDAVNEGTIDGYINNVTKFIYDKDDYDTNEDEATPIDPEDITFTVVYDDNGQVPANGDLLAKRVDSTTPTRRTYKVRVEFNSTATSVPEEDITYMCVFKTTYGQNAPESEPNMLHVVSSTTITMGNEIPVGVNARSTPAEAMEDWSDITFAPNDTKPIFLSYLLDGNDRISESYAGFVVTEEMAQANSGMVAKAYYLRGNVDESLLTTKSVYEDNVDAIKEAFNYYNYPSRCVEDSPVNSPNIGCSVDGLHVFADSHGFVIILDDSGWGCEVSGNYSSCYAHEI